MATAYDVTVVGAGVVGAAIAWRLSQDDLRVLWLEAAYDVAEGASKANSAIVATGYDTEPGTLESELLRASNPRWEGICAALDVPFRRVGALVLAFTEEELPSLRALAARAARLGVEAEMIAGDQARALLPLVSGEALAALHVPDEGIIDPLRLTLAYAELAVANGVELRLSTPVTGFRSDPAGRITHVRTPAGDDATGQVVNAAGLHADEISRLAGAERFQTWPRKGEFLLVDRELGQHVTKILAPVPSPRTRGVLVVPTTNGSLLLGPTADDGDDKRDRATDGPTLERVLAAATRLLPGIERRHITKTFAGLRPAADPTYRVERSALVPNLVHAAGIRSTGVSSSPAVADRVHDLLVEGGLATTPQADAQTKLPRLPRLAELPAEEVVRLAAGDHGYRLVVCTCEHVSAAEIRAALRARVPATSLDGVRKRTRAGGGRCQGAYCLAGIGFLLSLERGLPPGAVPQAGPGTCWGLG